MVFKSQNIEILNSIKYEVRKMFKYVKSRVRYRKQQAQSASVDSIFCPKEAHRGNVPVNKISYFFYRFTSLYYFYRPVAVRFAESFTRYPNRYDSFVLADTFVRVILRSWSGTVP